MPFQETPDQVGAVSCTASICFFAGSKAAVITAVVNWAIGINLGNVLIDGDDEEPLIITSADCRAPSEPNHDGAKSPRSECRGRDPRNVRRIPSMSVERVGSEPTPPPVKAKSAAQEYHDEDDQQCIRVHGHTS